MKKLGLLGILCFSVLIGVAQNYVPVDDGSKVHFVIKNFGINTGGDFQGLDGDIFFDPSKIKQCFFQVTVEAKTVDTDNNSRDDNLHDPEYFDVGQSPRIMIVSTKIDKTNKTDEGYYYFTGKLIIKGVSKPLAFPFHAEKKGSGYFFTGEFSLNRLDFEVGSKSSVLSHKVVVSLKVYAKPK